MHDHRHVNQGKETGMNMLTKNWERWGLALCRVIIGYLWFTQLSWKMPPMFGCLPGFAAGDLAQPEGLCGWTGVMAQYSIFEPHRLFVQNVFLPNISWMGWLVFMGEAFVALSLVFGVLTRLGGIAGLLMAVNLYLGLAFAPHEWYWSYAMLATLQLIFMFAAPGRTLGIDAWLTRMLEPKANQGGRLARALLWLM
jgi:hypothetical protein